jgi:hypothetical protein
MVGTIDGYGFHSVLIQPAGQSAPSGTGGTGVTLGVGVSVAGAGVEVDSPGGTVSVGTGLFVTVSVTGNVGLANPSTEVGVGDT